MSADAMWRNEPDRLQKAKNHARMARNRKEFLSSHSIMLSAYITALGGKPVERHHPVKFTVLALWHTFFLLRRRNELNHNQLDVLVQFLLKFRARLPFVKRTVRIGKPRRWSWHRWLDRIVNNLAGEEGQLVTTTACVKPHQVALAFMTLAEVCYATTDNFEAVVWYVDHALGLEREIRAEEVQPQGLRQLVRIFRKAGELYGKEEMFNWQPEKARGYLNQALELAKGEADAPDQVEKIKESLRKLV